MRRMPWQELALSSLFFRQSTDRFVEVTFDTHTSGKVRSLFLDQSRGNRRRGGRQKHLRVDRAARIIRRLGATVPNGDVHRDRCGVDLNENSDWDHDEGIGTLMFQCLPSWIEVGRGNGAVIAMAQKVSKDHARKVTTVRIYRCSSPITGRPFSVRLVQALAAGA